MMAILFRSPYTWAYCWVNSAAELATGLLASVTFASFVTGRAATLAESLAADLRRALRDFLAILSLPLRY
jgi:hypothetical protein